MKVLFDNIIFELQYAGGISNVWYNISKHLLSNTKLNLFFIEGSNVNNLFRQKLEIKNKNILKDRSFPLTIRRFISVKNNESDIYHSSFFRPISLIRNSKTKVVLTIHDFIYEKYSSILARKLHVFLKNRALKQADAVICVSNNTKSDFLKYYPNFDINKIFVVHNGVDSVFSPIIKSEQFKIQNLKLFNNKYLLYVGNRGYCKNFDFVIKLLTNLPREITDFRLICVGGGKPSKKEMRLLNKLNISHMINFIQNCSVNDLNILYNNAFCLLFPSIYEGFGIPAVEAMKAGCPIWSTNSSSVIELIGSEYPFSFSPEIWGDALNAFNKMFDDKMRTKAISIGLDRSSSFSWQKCANETLEVYKKITINEK